MELGRTGSGALVLNDAYNANPVSTEAALRALAQLPARRRIAVLGPMLELGPFEADEHRRIGALAGALGIECPLTVGRAGRGGVGLPRGVPARARARGRGAGGGG